MLKSGETCPRCGVIKLSEGGVCSYCSELVYTQDDIDNAVADERVKWEKIIDIVIENKYEPDKWPKEVRERMPMTLREAIRNRCKEVHNV